MLSNLLRIPFNPKITVLLKQSVISKGDAVMLHQEVG